MRTFSTLVLAIAILATSNHVFAQSGNIIEVDQAIIQLIDEVDVPSRVAGIIAELKVREGYAVTEGQIVGRLDDSKAAIKAAQAEAEYRVAASSADSTVAIDLAKTDVEDAKHKKKELSIDHKISKVDAENDVYVRLAQKSYKVADSELKRAEASREAFIKAVPQSEIDTLKLRAEKHLMEEEQAKHEMNVKNLTSDLKELSVGGSDIKLHAAELKVKESTENRERAGLQAELEDQKRKLAQLEVEHHQISAPLDGVVAEVYKHKGEWVEPGVKVMRIVRLNKLRAEGFVHSDSLMLLKKGARVTFTMERNTQNGVQVLAQVDGELTFISPEAHPVDGKVAIWAEFDNPGLKLRPGMKGRLSIAVSK